MLYGDTANVLRDGSDILELIGEEQKDTRGKYDVREYSIGGDPDVDSVNPKGVLYMIVHKVPIHMYIHVQPIISDLGAMHV